MKSSSIFFWLIALSLVASFYVAYDKYILNEDFQVLMSNESDGSDLILEYKNTLK